MGIKFYSDREKKVINLELFASDAETVAKKIYDSGKPNKNKISQIRKFFDEALKFDSYLKQGEEYQAILPYIKMIHAKVKYAEGRNLVTPDFSGMIKDLINQLDEKDPKSFEIFLSFFEAFMGYYKFFYESSYKERRINQ